MNISIIKNYLFGCTIALLAIAVIYYRCQLAEARADYAEATVKITVLKQSVENAKATVESMKKENELAISAQKNTNDLLKKCHKSSTERELAYATVESNMNSDTSEDNTNENETKINSAQNRKGVEYINSLIDSIE